MDKLSALRRQLLEAREARQALIERASGADRAVVFASTNIPGRDKYPPGITHLLGQAADEVAGSLPTVPLHQGLDGLGPWAAFGVPLPPDAVKRATIDIEATLPAGRLLDLDVYAADGRQVNRASLGLPARACLVCDRPAVECMRLARHSPDAVVAAAAVLLHPHSVRSLAHAFVTGARIELELTPKPGLVDRLDNGSHPDLSFDSMCRSIDLLPEYFEELLETAGPLAPAGGGTIELEEITLRACVEAGRRAERRMIEAIGANAHKGYIFLAGLLLLAAASAPGRRGLRSSVRALARRLLAPRPAVSSSHPSGAPSHGARARAEHDLGGVYREALDGLPSVFERGLRVLAAGPALSDGKDDLGRGRVAGHLLMATLMQAVEDTTAVHRCGPDALARLRADGTHLQQLIESGQNYVPWLAALNAEYQRLNLTMGGVADCMALSFALDAWSRPCPLALHP